MELTLRGSNVTAQLWQLWWQLWWLRQLWFPSTEKTPWVWFATQKNGNNNNKKHTNRHLQGRPCNLVLILTSDVATTTRFYAESRQITNNNKTRGVTHFATNNFAKNKQLFCVGLFISKSQTVDPVLDTKSSCYQVVCFLCWIPPLSACFPSFGMFFCCRPPCCVHTANVIRCHNELNDRTQHETKDVV